MSAFFREREESFAPPPRALMPRTRAAPAESCAHFDAVYPPAPAPGAQSQRIPCARQDKSARCSQTTLRATPSCPAPPLPTGVCTHHQSKASQAGCCLSPSLCVGRASKPVGSTDSTSALLSRCAVARWDLDPATGECTLHCIALMRACDLAPGRGSGAEHPRHMIPAWSPPVSLSVAGCVIAMADGHGQRSSDAMRK